jgi:plastocyanin
MAKNFEVRIAGMAFDQKNITISAGDSVTWINDDGATSNTTHSVTTDPGSPLSIPEIVLDPNVPLLWSSRQTFPTAGVFNYHCKFHPMMAGNSVTVT